MNVYVAYMHSITPPEAVIIGTYATYQQAIDAAEDYIEDLVFAGGVEYEEFGPDKDILICVEGWSYGVGSEPASYFYRAVEVSADKIVWSKA